MRRLAVLAPIAALVGALLARRRHRRAQPAAPPPRVAPPQAPPSALPAPATRFVSVPWTIVAAPEDRAELTLRFTCDAHMQLDRVDAQETPTQVFVTVLTRWQPPADGWFAWEREHEATVRLSSPLGSRALVHAPVDVPPPGASGDDPSGPPLYP